MIERAVRNGHMPESRETPRVRTETISGAELIERIYQRQSLPQDPRFLSGRDGGAFKYFDLPKILRRKKTLHYSTVSEGDTVVGIAELEKSPDLEGMYWMSFVSVDPAYQGRGFSKRLLADILRFADTMGISIQLSRFTEQGEQRLKSQFEEMAKSSSVKIIPA